MSSIKNKMKKLFILFLIFFCGCCGCASNDIQTINLLNQRINTLEKQIQASPRVLNDARNDYNHPNRLNDAQKDFVEFMLNYLGEEGE